VSAELRAHARDIINRRRRRGNFFPAAIFDEVAWEILLTLYAFDEATHTAAFVARSLQCPPSTSQRWIDYLASQQLVARLSNPEDERVTAITLTTDGRRRIEAYLAEASRPAPRSGS
jgi:DNA-binding MarR family transcriptional regulator